MTKSSKPRTTAKAPQPVSTDPRVPTPDTQVPANVPPTKEGISASAEGAPAAAETDLAAATQPDGTVDPQAAAIAGQAQREQTEAAKRADTTTAGPVPTGGIVRQLEDGAETDRRTGAQAARSLAGENLPVLRQNEPDPRQGVTTGELTNPGVPDPADAETVTFLTGYHLYNRGEQVAFAATEAQRLRDLGVAE